MCKRDLRDRLKELNNGTSNYTRRPKYTLEENSSRINAFLCVTLCRRSRFTFYKRDNNDIFSANYVCQLKYTLDKNFFIILMDLLILDFLGKYNKTSLMLETATFSILCAKKIVLLK